MSRPTLREARDRILRGETFSRFQIVRLVDEMHDRLRDETLAAIDSATVADFGTGADWIRRSAARDKVRAVFDRRKRRRP